MRFCFKPAAAGRGLRATWVLALVDCRKVQVGLDLSPSLLHRTVQPPNTMRRPVKQRK